jgi:hypothetical protein
MICERPGPLSLLNSRRCTRSNGVEEKRAKLDVVARRKQEI